MTKKAVVLLSGGLDSTVSAFVARKDIGKKGKLYTLSFYYGQRHYRELDCASEIAELLGSASHLDVPIPMECLAESALLGDSEIPTEGLSSAIPSTWVPQRNTIFLALAAAFAEKVDADFIYTGFNSIDYSGYPDCRPEFVESMNKTINLASKRYIETGRGFSIETPIIRKSKKEIVELGLSLEVPFGLTWSCYQGGILACGECDSCRIRRKAFIEAGSKDPLEYENA